MRVMIEPWLSRRYINYMANGFSYVRWTMRREMWLCRDNFSLTKPKVDNTSTYYGWESSCMG